MVFTQNISGVKVAANKTLKGMMFQEMRSKGRVAIILIGQEASDHERRCSETPTAKTLQHVNGMLKC